MIIMKCLSQRVFLNLVSTHPLGISSSPTQPICTPIALSNSSIDVYAQFSQWIKEYVDIVEHNAVHGNTAWEEYLGANFDIRSLLHGLLEAMVRGGYIAGA